MLARIEKVVENAARRFLGGKAKSAVVRKLSGTSREAARKLFRQTHALRRFSFGGALLGVGVIYLFSTLYDRIKAIAALFQDEPAYKDWDFSFLHLFGFGSNDGSLP